MSDGRVPWLIVAIARCMLLVVRVLLWWVRVFHTLYRRRPGHVRRFGAGDAGGRGEMTMVMLTLAAWSVLRDPEGLIWLALILQLLCEVEERTS